MPRSPSSLGEVADQYVKLALALGAHDPEYVDAYFGPVEWRREAATAQWTLQDIQRRAQCLLADLGDAGGPGHGNAPAAETAQIRARSLGGQLRALNARAGILGGGLHSFDEESRALFGVVAPRFRDDYFREVIDRLDGALPGAGSLRERFAQFREQLSVPADRFAAAAEATTAHARSVTLAHCPLPAGEQLRIEYVGGQPWSGYLWYRGDFEGLVQYNTAVPVRVSDLVDLVCHETYPGHHAQFVLTDQVLVRERGWREFTVNTLYTPRRLLWEGCATFAVDVALPGNARMTFEREVLAPLTGLSPCRIDESYRVRAVSRHLWPASIEAARRYLDRELSADQTIEWLQHYGLLSRLHAEQHIAFYDRYRSAYVQYVCGKPIVEQAVDVGKTPAERWRAFRELLVAPALPDVE